MKRILTYPINSTENGLTIKQFLMQQGCSHAVLVQLKQTEHGILVNEKWSYVNDALHTGDSLTITLCETNAGSDICPVKLPFSLIYEDEDILVADKPAGMPIHPSMNNYDNTLANAVMYHWKQSDCFCPFRCVNRLDRDTTGLTVLAKHTLSSAVLSRRMKEREIKRTYLAIVNGITPLSGTIDAPIARKDGSTIERTVDFSSGEHAVTHYRRIATQNNLSLLALQLETGRTHQIRVHMKYIGYPLIGDFLYHPDMTLIKRQALHAWHLSFYHPISQEPCTFYAPLPCDMAELFPNIDLGSEIYFA